MSTDRLFVCCVTGDLHRIVDNRIEQNPIRSNYSRTHNGIESVADLKATLRAGAFAWPGGYPLYFVTADGESLSFDTVRREFRQIVSSVKHRDNTGGWRVVGTDINWESDLVDAHTGATIPSAYGAN